MSTLSGGTSTCQVCPRGHGSASSLGNQRKATKHRAQRKPQLRGDAQRNKDEILADWRCRAFTKRRERVARRKSRKDARQSASASARGTDHSLSDAEKPLRRSEWRTEVKEICD